MQTVKLKSPSELLFPSKTVLSNKEMRCSQDIKNWKASSRKPVMASYITWHLETCLETVHKLNALMFLKHRMFCFTRYCVEFQKHGIMVLVNSPMKSLAFVQ